MYGSLKHLTDYSDGNAGQSINIYRIHNREKGRHSSMLRVVLEPVTLVLELSNAKRALDRVATVRVKLISLTSSYPFGRDHHQPVYVKF
jgi:hypothetical protein